jgi:chromate reductase
LAETPVTLVTFVGSLRKDAYNAALARALPELAPAGATIVAGPTVGDIPLYTADIQNKDGFPSGVQAIAKAVAEADGVILVTPEYNHSYSGVLKNAIDWVSRMDPQPFKDKPVAIQSASQGPMGGIRAQLALRQVLVFLRAITFTTPEVIVTFAQQKFENGVLKDEATRKVIATQLEEFATFVRKVR